MPRRKGKKSRHQLSLNRIYGLANLAEVSLKPLAEKMIREFDMLQGKEKIAFMRFLAAQALVTDRLRHDLGLDPKSLTGGAQHPLLSIISKDLDVQAFKALPPEERRQFFLKLVSGEQTPKVIDAEVVQPKEKDAGSTG